MIKIAGLTQLGRRFGLPRPDIDFRPWCVMAIGELFLRPIGLGAAQSSAGPVVQEAPVSQGNVASKSILQPMVRLRTQTNSLAFLPWLSAVHFGHVQVDLAMRALST